MRKIITITIIALIVFCSILITTTGLCSDGVICIVLDVDATKPSDSYLARRVQVSDQVEAEITAITELSGSGKSQYRVHASIRCQHSTRFSLASMSWENTFLASSSQIEHKLREFVGVSPDKASTISGGENLLP